MHLFSSFFHFRLYSTFRISDIAVPRFIYYYDRVCDDGVNIRRNEGDQKNFLVTLIPSFEERLDPPNPLHPLLGGLCDSQSRSLRDFWPSLKGTYLFNQLHFRGFLRLVWHFSARLTAFSAFFAVSRTW